MADTPQPRAPYICQQCGRPSAFRYQSGLVLCLEHAMMFDEMNRRSIEMYRELAERAEDDIADSVGMPRRVRPPRIPAPRVNLNQINVGQNFGVVNTGTVEAINNHVSTIGVANESLAAALRQLMDGIVASAELTDPQKQEAAELLRVVTEDATRPPEQRQPRAVIRAVASGLQTVLANAANLAQLWSVIAPHLPGQA